MAKRKTKRTAGERRYRHLQNKTKDAAQHISFLRNRVEELVAENKHVNPGNIVRILTEAIERLKAASE